MFKDMIKDEIAEKFEDATKDGQYHGFYFQELGATETLPNKKI